MSHVTVHKEKVSDRKLFCDVARSKGFQVNEEIGSVKLFGSQQVENAVSVHVTGWNYPLAITEDGAIHYDHFGSQAGTMEKFQDLMTSYNEQVTVKNIPMDIVSGYYFETQEDGTRQLVMEYA